MSDRAVERLLWYQNCNPPDGETARMFASIIARLQAAEKMHDEVRAYLRSRAHDHTIEIAIAAYERARAAHTGQKP